MEGGLNLGSQLYANGGDLRKVNYSEVGANALGGAVAGAIAGATGGASLLAEAAVGSAANVAGGIVTRAVEGEDAADVVSLGEISADALSGFAGGAGGHLASEFVHIPDELGERPKGRRKLIKYEAALAARNQAIAKSIAIGTAATAPFTHGAHYFVEQFFYFVAELFVREPQPHVSHKITYGGPVDPKKVTSSAPDTGIGAEKAP